MKRSRAQLLYELSVDSEHAYHRRIPEHSWRITDQATYRGFIGIRSFGTVIALRGTATFRDVLVDALAVKGDFLEKYRAHLGFILEFQEIWPDIKEWCFEPPITVTGHSLGGALATLIAMALKVEKDLPSTLVTFGSPRVFNPEGAVQCEALVDDVVRVVHEWDFVPRMPKLDYRHVGPMLRVLDTGRIANPVHSLWGWILQKARIIETDLDGEGPADHHISKYVSSLAWLRDRLE